MSKLEMYQQTDKYLELLKKKIRTEFNHLSVLGFDELNVVQIKKELTEMYQRLMDFNKEQYAKIVKQTRKYAKTQLTADQQELANLMGYSEGDFVEYVLNLYDSVTGYLYKSEAERKRLRQGEEMATAREFQDRNRYDEVLKKSANLWFTQSGQYAITLEDAALKDSYEKAGIKKVKWIAENDSRTCKICSALSGQVFDIDDVPEKQHYHCRCYIVPYK